MNEGHITPARGVDTDRRDPTHRNVIDLLAKKIDRFAGARKQRSDPATTPQDHAALELAAQLRGHFAFDFAAECWYSCAAGDPIWRPARRHDVRNRVLPDLRALVPDGFSDSERLCISNFRKLHKKSLLTMPYEQT